MPLIELVDETYLACEPDLVAAAVHDPLNWSIWWPELDCTPFMDRGSVGVRWSVAGKEWVGSIELWLEAVSDGVLVHHYQRLDPVAPGRVWSPRRVSAERQRRAQAWKRHALDLKDGLEGGRRPGTPIHSDRSSPGEGVPTLGG